MKPNIKKDCAKRMNYLMGHLAGVKKMLEEERYCIDIIQQNLGVISALHKINDCILKNHFATCVRQAVKSDDKKSKEKILNELINIFKRSKT